MGLTEPEGGARPAAGIALEDHAPEGAAGPPLLLVHGSGGTRAHWPEALRRLPGRRIVSVDLPGHGASAPPGEHGAAAYARRLVALLDALAIPRAAVAGHSLGGAIALQLALDAPDRVAGLLLVGTGARLRVLRAVLEATADPARAAEAAAAVAAACFAPGADPGMVRDLARGMAAAAPGILHGDLRACDGFDVMERLPGIRAPAVVVCGEGDRLTPPRYAGFLAASLPRSTLRMVPGAGHMVAWEAPGAVVAAAEELLAEIS